MKIGLNTYSAQLPYKQHLLHALQ